MTVGATDRLRLLHGADAPLADMQELRAGPVTLLVDGVDLRYLRIGGTELVRRVYAAVRDVDWDTVPGAISNFRVEQGERSFRIEFDARHTRPDIDLSWHGRISGDESGRVEYVFDGRAESTCRYARIGICVHHPWRETAGAPFSAHTADGTIEGVFPDLIGPQPFDGLDGVPLFPSFDRLEVSLATGGRLLLEFEGGLWEVEDHRNWTDANFKTYTAPLSSGTPAPLETGEVFRQRVVVTPLDVASHDPPARPVRLTIGQPTGTRVSPVGLEQDRDRHELDDHERSLLTLLAPAHLRVEIRLDRDDWQQALAAAQKTAAALGSQLELSLHLLKHHRDQLAPLAALLGDGPTVSRVLVVNAHARTGSPTETTAPELVDLARETLAEAVPGAAFVGGTEIYFTEINRTRPQLHTWDGVCYSISPQIHAFTDVDVMENLDAQAETVRGARAIAGDKQVIVSPVTLRRRVNFHAAGDPPQTAPGELPDSIDVRQSSLFGAAWTAGSLKYLAEAGTNAVTYYETTGWRGVIERAGGSELSERFHSIAGAVFPLFHPLADAIEWCGARVLHCDSTDVLAAVALAVRPADGTTHLLIANLTPQPLAVVVEEMRGEVLLRRLHEHNVTRAMIEPEDFRGERETAVADGGLPLTLSPYEVVRVDPA